MSWLKVILGGGKTKKLNTFDYAYNVLSGFRQHIEKEKSPWVVIEPTVMELNPEVALEEIKADQQRIIAEIEQKEKELRTKLAQEQEKLYDAYKKAEKRCSAAVDIGISAQTEKQEREEKRSVFYNSVSVECMNLDKEIVNLGADYAINKHKIECVRQTIFINNECRKDREEELKPKTRYASFITTPEKLRSHFGPYASISDNIEVTLLLKEVMYEAGMTSVAYPDFSEKYDLINPFVDGLCVDKCRKGKFVLSTTNPDDINFNQLFQAFERIKKHYQATEWDLVNKGTDQEGYMVQLRPPIYNGSYNADAERFPDTMFSRMLGALACSASQVGTVETSYRIPDGAGGYTETDLKGVYDFFGEHHGQPAECISTVVIFKNKIAAEEVLGYLGVEQFIAKDRTK